MDPKNAYAGWLGVAMIVFGLVMGVAGVGNVINFATRGDVSGLLMGAAIFQSVGGFVVAVASFLVRRQRQRRTRR